MHRSKQSKTEKDRQNKTKQILNELIEESNRLRNIRHERHSSKNVLIYQTNYIAKKISVWPRNAAAFLEEIPIFHIYYF